MLRKTAAAANACGGEVDTDPLAEVDTGLDNGRARIDETNEKVRAIRQLLVVRNSTNKSTSVLTAWRQRMRRRSPLRGKLLWPKAPQNRRYLTHGRLMQIQLESWPMRYVQCRTPEGRNALLVRLCTGYAVEASRETSHSDPVTLAAPDEHSSTANPCSGCC